MEKEGDVQVARGQVPQGGGIGVVSPVDSSLDENYTLYKQYDNVQIDESEAKRVLRKIDLRILPILFVTYMLQYLDKNSLNFASVYGLAKGTGLKGQDYSWLGTFELQAHRFHH